MVCDVLGAHVWKGHKQSGQQKSHGSLFAHTSLSLEGGSPARVYKRPETCSVFMRHVSGGNTDVLLHNVHSSSDVVSAEHIVILHLCVRKVAAAFLEVKGQPISAHNQLD